MLLGKALLEMGEEIEEFYNEFQEQFLQYCKEVFEIGQKHYKIRSDEINQFLKSVNASQKENQQESIHHMEAFIDKKAELSKKVNKLINDLDDDKIDELEFKVEIEEITAEFNTLTHKTWKELMRLELILFEQMEDVIQHIDRVISK